MNLIRTSSVRDFALSSLQGGGTMQVWIAFSNFGDPLDLGIPADVDVIPVDLLTTPAATAPTPS